MIRTVKHHRKVPETSASAQRGHKADMAKTVKSKPTTPEQEGIELHPDSWKRFEETAEKVARYRPNRRTAAKPADANRKPRGSKRAS
jgi:hypothetical protein